MLITSTSNPKVKRLVSLRKKRKVRDEEQVFLTEGIRMFMEVPPEQLKELYVSETFYAKEMNTIDAIAKTAGVRPEIFSDSVFAYLSDTRTPQGVLCIVRRSVGDTGEVLAGKCPHILVLQDIQDPGNLGTMIRTAEGAGVTGIVMSKECVDIYNPKTIRSTMGSVYRMPFVYVENLPGFIHQIKHLGVHVYAAHLEGKKAYDEVSYLAPSAFLIGNEGNGLSADVARAADTYIRIPMAGEVESLNAAVAASILMFEVSRQRRHT